MKQSIKPREVRIRFVCPRCGTNLWLFEEYKYGGIMTCHKCKARFGWGVSVMEVTETNNDSDKEASAVSDNPASRPA